MTKSRTAVAALLLLGCALLGAADLIGQGPGARPIEVTECTINLIDDVILACDRPGIIAAVEVREGDAVEADQIVVRLEDAVAQAALNTAEEEARSTVDIRYSEKAGEVARAEFDKSSAANRTMRVVPQIELDRLRLAWEKTVLELENAHHRKAINLLKRDEAQAQLDTFRVKAPFAGVVTRVHRARGEAVRQGDQVLELASTARVRVEGEIHIRDMDLVRPGAEVAVRLTPGEIDPQLAARTFRGRIVFKDVKVVPVRRRVRVWAEVQAEDNDGATPPAGLMATMTIHPVEAP